MSHSALCMEETVQNSVYQVRSGRRIGVPPAGEGQLRMSSMRWVAFVSSSLPLIISSFALSSRVASCLSAPATQSTAAFS